MKHKLIALALALLPLSAAHATDQFFGDSLTMICPGAPSTCYPPMLSVMTGQSFNNFAVGGSQAADQYSAIFSYNPVPGDRAFYLVGTNDAFSAGTMGKYTDPSVEQAVFQMTHLAEIYWLGSNKITTKGHWTETGTWANEGIPWGVGRYTTQYGATGTTTFFGDTLIIGYSLEDNVAAQFTVSVDGASPSGPYSTATPGLISTWRFNAVVAPAILRLTGYGPGKHSVKITNVTTSGQPLFIDYIWQGANTTQVVIMTTPLILGPYAYQCYSNPCVSWNGSDALMNSFAAIERSNVASAVADGLDVVVVDTNMLINPNTDLATDNVHLGLAGTTKIANALFSAVPVLTPAQVFSGNDGYFYVNAGHGKKRLTTQ